MPVSAQDVERVAELANLELSSAEKLAMLRDLNSVLEYFAQLNDLDTSAVPPMAQVTGTGTIKTSQQQFRQDEVAPSLDRGRVLASAPDSDGIYFKVPKVIER